MREDEEREEEDAGWKRDTNTHTDMCTHVLNKARTFNPHAHSYFHFIHTRRDTQRYKNKHWFLTCTIFLIFIQRPFKWMVTCPTCHQTTIRTFQIIINSTGFHPHFTLGQPWTIPWHRWRHNLSNDMSHGHVTHHPTDSPDLTTPTQPPNAPNPPIHPK